SVIDIDLFDTDATSIADYKSTGKKVICYFSAGTREDWRDDKGSFQSSDYGKEMDEWPGENWVKVTSDNVKAIMKKRIALAKEKGCDAIDPDNVDGFSGNQDGWGLKKDDYAAYVKFLAQEAASANLAIGLKNALDLIPDVIDVVQFAVNEQCHEYSECDKYKPFTTANKAVFNIEY
ncbi:glycoside hydrolase family 114 protein, partial [Periconia macrospinosa]